MTTITLCDLCKDELVNGVAAQVLISVRASNPHNGFVKDSGAEVCSTCHEALKRAYLGLVREMPTLTPGSLRHERFSEAAALAAGKPQPGEEVKP